MHADSAATGSAHEWLGALRLDRYEEGLFQLGVVVVRDLIDMDDTDLANLGMSRPECKRFRRRLALDARHGLLGKNVSLQGSPLLGNGSPAVSPRGGYSNGIDSDPLSPVSTSSEQAADSFKGASMHTRADAGGMYVVVSGSCVASSQLSDATAGIAMWEYQAGDWL